MKKTLWIVMAAALIAAVVTASAQEVLSQNAVGYIKKTLPAGGKFVAMSIPLDSMSSTEIVFGETSLAEEAPVNTFVYFWDSVAQTWNAGGKSGKGWGPAEAGYVLQPGEGFLMKSEVGSTEDVDVTITGEVPSDATLSRGIPGSDNFGSLANPYPVDFTFGTSALASNAPVDTFVYFWDVDAQTWNAGGKSGKGWGPAEAGYEVQAGEGFLMRAPGGATTWDAEKPYTWP
ncbi:MAG: hypothetical protein PHO14_01215 [Kiritimatiellae bacterium]|nr:hypothetical protein [Kiritimatiellia bacterium]MDD4340835.1 hypothetical protein [Kiritimatiellia bacterium]